MQKTQLVIFKKEDTEALLNQFGFKINKSKAGKKNKTVITDRNNEPVCCPTCNKPIPLKNVGTIA